MVPSIDQVTKESMSGSEDDKNPLMEAIPASMSPLSKFPDSVALPKTYEVITGLSFEPVMDMWIV